MLFSYGLKRTVLTCFNPHQPPHEDAGDGAAPAGWERLPLFLVQDVLNWRLLREHRNTASGNCEALFFKKKPSPHPPILEDVAVQYTHIDALPMGEGS